MKPRAVAVLDVGKTNKKVAVYDRRLALVFESKRIVATRDHQGIEVENTPELLEWLRGALTAAAREFAIEAIAVTTHGATVAVLDEQGALVHPVISYTHAQGAQICADFFKAYGSEPELHQRTSTADFGFINAGKILHFMKTRLPEAWKRARHVLLYPQYFGYEFTGRRAVEPTYLGNHTYLWDFAAWKYSEVARGLGVDRMLPQQIKEPWDELGPLRREWAEACGISPACKVAVGIHDSNSSLLGYLVQGYPTFTLNSTGTWCVGMRRSENAVLSEEELQTKTFFNLDAFRHFLKTSIFLGGMEYEHFSRLTEHKDQSTLEHALRVLRERKLFILPGVVRDGCIFPNCAPRVVEDGQARSFTDLAGEGRPMSVKGQEYFAALNLSLALQTGEMLRLLGTAARETVFVEGGFSKNTLYCELLAALHPTGTVALSEIKEATSFGAALVAWTLAEGLRPEALKADFTIQQRRIEPRALPGLEDYRRDFLKLARG